MWLVDSLGHSTVAEHPLNFIYMPLMAFRASSLFEKIDHNTVNWKKKSLNIDTMGDTIPTFWSILNL